MKHLRSRRETLRDVPITRIFVLLLISMAASGVHLATGDLAGMAPHVFFFASVISFGFLIRPQSLSLHYVSLVGVVELYFLFDYVFYGTLVCALGRTKVPLGTPMGEAYSDGYWVATASVLSFAVGVWLRSARRLPSRLAPPRHNEGRICRMVFTFTVLAGLAGLVILMRDPATRDQFLYAHIGLAPAVGMGRYTAAVFVLPSAGVALWYTATRALRKQRRFVSWRIASGVALFGLSLIHLAQGRRLMWLCTVLMALHLVRLASGFRVKTWHVAVSVPCILVISTFVEASKNRGISDVMTASEGAVVNSQDAILAMVDNSMGRFDLSAAIIADRPNQGYYFGRSFLESLTAALPSSMREEQHSNLRYQLGRLIYGSAHADLVSQEGSLVAETYANLGYAGCIIVFLVLGYCCASLDLRFQNAPTPLAAIGYAFALCRIGHHLVTVSHSSMPLTFYLFAPWILSLLLVKLGSPHQQAQRSLANVSGFTPVGQTVEARVR